VSARELVSAGQLEQELRALPDWTYDGDGLHREFRFPGFAAAFGFMCGVALLAQRMDHHPDWSNSFDVVRISLRTHDLGGVSSWDVRLARQIDDLAGQTSGARPAAEDAGKSGTPSAGK
jgi:4a-hydroxytetrahydrobiopterin dehydratase